jgi:DnaJ family protein A protein 2
VHNVRSQRKWGWRGGGGGHDDLLNMFLEEAADAEGHCHKGEDVNHPLKVSLEDLYNGKMVKLAVSDQAMDGEATMFLTWDILTPLLKLL